MFKPLLFQAILSIMCSSHTCHSQYLVLRL